MLTITYFVHSTTTDNETGLATGWAPGALSQLGIQQAKELGPLAASQDFFIVFCSDLARAVDTATLAFGDRYEIVQDRRLREADYGDYTRKPDLAFNRDMTNYIEIPYPGGESYRDVEKRMADFLNYALQMYGEKQIAIVAHRAPQLALDVLLKGKTWEQAIAEDWRHTKSWQPGWEYVVNAHHPDADFD